VLEVIKLTGQLNKPDNPTLPFKLEVTLRAPEFMNVAFILMHGGSEELVVRATTAEELTEFTGQQHFDTHVRLTRWSITGPEGVVSSGP
jgi:hypothetical protein